MSILPPTKSRSLIERVTAPPLIIEFPGNAAIGFMEIPAKPGEGAMIRVGVKNEAHQQVGQALSQVLAGDDGRYSFTMEGGDGRSKTIVSHKTPKSFSTQQAVKLLDVFHAEKWITASEWKRAADELTPKVQLGAYI